MTDQTVRYFEPFDLDVTLRDAALDDQNRPTRRMLANAAIGMHVEDAYYSVRELREAVSWIHKGRRGANASSPRSSAIRQGTTSSAASISAWPAAASSR